tara:strand:- start:26 stop:439 length:414 start_codon:yes stop_codon:yes gene_type:complete
MNKKYTFYQETDCIDNANVKYFIETSNATLSGKTVQFDAIVEPPNGHKLFLKKIKYYLDKQTLYVPKGAGFTLSPSRRLNVRLSKIGIDLGLLLNTIKVQQKAKKKEETKKKKEEKAPKLFSRTSSEKLKSKIIKGS